jgi:hypothetical protein
MNSTNSMSWKEQSTFYNDSAIIPPPPSYEAKIKHKAKSSKAKIIIDSRDRNMLVWPTPSKYSIKLDNPLNDIVSIELTDYSIPLERQLINNTNNTFYYSPDNGTTVKTINIGNGNYDGKSLATELQTKFGSDISSVAYSDTNQRLTINTNNNNFIILSSQSGNNNINNILGFSNTDTQANSNSIQSNYALNLQGENYIIMMLENAITNISNNQYINRSFAVIRDNTHIQEIIKKTFNPTLNNFSTFSISFYDYYGALFDFDNKNHRLEFVVETLNKA